MSDAFPTIVYRIPGPHTGPTADGYDFIGVNDAAELKSALANGWHASLSEASGAIPAKEVIEPAAPKVRQRRKRKVGS